MEETKSITSKFKGDLLYYFIYMTFRRIHNCGSNREKSDYDELWKGERG
jgi:hypothetical protein